MPPLRTRPADRQGTACLEPRSLALQPSLLRYRSIKTGRKPRKLHLASRQTAAAARVPPASAKSSQPMRTKARPTGSTFAAKRPTLAPSTTSRSWEVRALARPIRPRARAQS